MKVLYKKILFLVLFNSFLVYMILPMSLGEITLGDSTFPLEKDEYITWKSVNATEPYYEDIQFIKFTATDVYNKSVNGNRYMFVNYTLEFYNKFYWFVKSADDLNAFYLSYNYTLNYLNWSEIVYKEAYLLIVPIPLNLTLISNAIMKEPLSPLNATYSGSTITLDFSNETIVETTFNSDGIATLIEKKTNETTVFRWELVDEDVIIIIPFGYSYLLVIVISIGIIIKSQYKKLENF